MITMPYIDNLLKWYQDNGMKLHPSKCKALAVTLQRDVLDNLPFNIYYYILGTSFIDNELFQRDLGVIITTRHYSEKYLILISGRPFMINGPPVSSTFPS